MKKIIILSVILFSSFSISAQDIDLNANIITNTLEATGGKFIIINDEINNPAKLEIFRTGEVNWFLNKQKFFLRDSNFEAYDGVYTSYDFIHVDGATGRIGFNVLSNLSYGELPLTSSIHLNGSIATRVRTLDGTKNYELKQDDHTVIVNLAGSDVTIDLPPAVDAKGRGYRIKRDALDTNSKRLLIDADGTELIDGNETYEVSKTLGVVELVCDGTQWWVLSAEDQLAYYSPATTSITLSEEHDVIGVSFSANDVNSNINLPDALVFDGKRFEVKRNANGAIFTNNTLTITPQIEQQLDQFTNDTPYQMPNDFESLTIQSNGTIWFIVNAYNH